MPLLIKLRNREHILLPPELPPLHDIEHTILDVLGCPEWDLVLRLLQRGKHNRATSSGRSIGCHHGRVLTHAAVVASQDLFVDDLLILVVIRPQEGDRLLHLKSLLQPTVNAVFVVAFLYQYEGRRIRRPSIDACGCTESATLARLCS